MIIFTIFLPVVIHLISLLQDVWHLKPAMTIAVSHGIFNITNTLIQLPFVAGLAWIVTKLVQGKDIADDYKPQHLNKDLVYHAPVLHYKKLKKNYKMWVRLSYQCLKTLAKLQKTIKN